MMDCIFCKIIDGKADAHLIMENDDLIAILDIDPISEGHTLIIPKQDVKSLKDLNEDSYSEILKAAAIISNAIQKAFNFDGISIMANEGAVQDVPHFHLHVFGRSKDKDIKIEYPETKSSLSSKAIIDLLRSNL